MRDLEPDGARSWALADHDIEREVLHRRVEDLLHRTVEPVDLVDKEHITRLQVGKDGRKVARALDGRSRGRLNLRSQLVGEDGSERRLAEARRAREDHVVEALAAALCCLDEDA